MRVVVCKEDEDRVSSNGHIFRFTAGLGIAAAGVALTSSLAFATGGSEGSQGGEHGGESSSYGYGDNAQIEIKGQIAPMCEFTTLPNVSSIGQMVTNNVTELGSLGFTCNMTATSPVSLTVKSLNGALKRYGGSETVAYQIAWNVQGANDAFATILTTSTPFGLVAGNTNTEQSGVYKVKVTGPTVGKPAGTYKDIVTYTISP